MRESSYAVGLAVSLACLLTAGGAFAQDDYGTVPGAIPDPSTYQGSTQLQQQEQQQDQQNQQQLNQQWQTQQQQTQGMLNDGSGQQSFGGGGASPVSIWRSEPLIAAAKNPLIGRWRFVGSKSAATTGTAQVNAFSQLLGPQFAQMAQNMADSMYGSTCKSLFGSGLVEFRPDTFVSIGSDGSAQVLNHVEYRASDQSIAMIPHDPGIAQFIVFDVSGNRITARNLGCSLERVNTAGQATLSGGSASSVPGASGATGTLDITAYVRIEGPGRNFAPIANSPVFVETRSLGEALGSVGLHHSPLRSWLDACQAKAPACQEGATAMAANPVAKAMTDAKGHVVVAVPTGHYFVFMVGGPPGQEKEFWSVPVDVNAGANSISLNGANSLYVPPT